MNRPPQGWVAWWRARSVEVCADVIARAEMARIAELSPPPVIPAPVRVPGPARRQKRRHAKRKARR